MFRELVCPISNERVDARVVRLVAGGVALLTVAYLATGWLAIPFFLIADFAVRGFGSGAASPLRALAAPVARRFGQSQPIDRAPKLFAARVGLLFSIAISALGVAGVGAAKGVAAVLLIFALLESVFDFCAGCWVYTYVVLPLYGIRSKIG